jgi:uncharacterized membrane-anchored protein
MQNQQYVHKLRRYTTKADKKIEEIRIMVEGALEKLVVEEVLEQLDQIETI